MAKKPKIDKFKGDNEQNFSLWIKQYEAHCIAVGVTEGKKLGTLLCCVEGTAFSYLSELKEDEENEATYATVKGSFMKRFCGEEFKRGLQIKLQNLRFTKGTPINVFTDELYTTIKQLCNIKESKTLTAIATSHVTNNLDPALREEAKVFQLTGNTRLENLLEVISVKMTTNQLSYDGNVGSSAMSLSERNRLEKVEVMMEKILNKLEEKPNTVDARREICEECSKPGHNHSSCFKLKTCYLCKEKGHISRYCKKSVPANVLNLQKHTYDNVTTSPEQRTMVEINIGLNVLDFLYDTGAQYSILTRKSYDLLKIKPPLSDVDRLGSGIDGNRFEFDRIVYLNLSFKTESGRLFTLQYQPVLISSAIKSNIYGAKTENRFVEEICRKERFLIALMNAKITLRCFKEKALPSTAYGEILHVATIAKNETKTVKGRI